MWPFGIQRLLDPQLSHPPKPSLLALLLSLLAAAFGVQSGERLRRDFSRRTPWPFIAGGVVGTALFVLTLWWLVQQVLRYYS